MTLLYIILGFVPVIFLLSLAAFLFMYFLYGLIELQDFIACKLSNYRRKDK